MRIIVTGANGYIGKCLIEYLDLQGNYVLPVSRSSANGVTRVSYENQIADCAKHYDAIIHLAGIAHRSGVSTNEYNRINYELTESLADIAQLNGVKHFVFFSTAKIHGEVTDYPINSSSQINPQDSYSESKARAEEALSNIQSDMLVTSIRPPVVYGREPKANIATLTERIKAGRIIPVGNPPNQRSFVSLENLCSSVSYVLQRKSTGYRGYLVDDRRPRSTKQFIVDIGRQLNKEPRLLNLPNSVLNIADGIFSMTHGRKLLAPLYSDFVIQCDLLERETGWRPQLP